jgi:hypothetical protein
MFKTQLIKIPFKPVHLKPLFSHLQHGIYSRVAEPHNFYAAPVPGKNFDAAPAAPAPAPTLLHSKAKFFKRTKF